MAPIAQTQGGRANVLSFVYAHPIFRRAIGPLVVLVLWHCASTYGWVDARFVPAPLNVLNSLKEWMFGPVGASPYSGTWFTHAANSFYRVIGGFLIASVFGVVLGCIIGWSRLTSDLLDPIIQIIRPIPITAWVPFAVIFFGIRDGSAFFLIALGAFFPIVVNTAAGVAGTPKLLVRAARMLGIRKQNILPRVVLPSAMPYIFTGLRLGIGLCVGVGDRRRDDGREVGPRFCNVGCLLFPAHGHHHRRDAERRPAWIPQRSRHQSDRKSRPALEPRPMSTTARKATSGSPRIVARGLRKEFVDISRQAQVVALSNIDLDIGEDEFLTILGPSGCGKSTLLNIIAGFEHATDGEVRLDGQTIRDPGPDRGVVFQEYALFPWLNVVQNIEFGLRERGVPKAERKVRVTRQISAVGLDGFEDRFPQELSGGMRQRVALARVLVNDPKILLMDEPFAALDAQTRTIMQTELLRVWSAERRTALFVTHNIEEAVLLGDRLVVMTARPGRIKEIVNVKLPRPRDVTSAEFNEIRRYVASLLESEVQTAFASMQAGKNAQS